MPECWGNFVILQAEIENSKNKNKNIKKKWQQLEKSEAGDQYSLR